jgi:Mce-associated membrane protein
MAVDADTTDELADPAGPEPHSVEHGDHKSPDVQRRARGGIRTAVAAGLIIVVSLGALTTWLGLRAHQSHRNQQQRNLALHVARQGALNLTTISYTDAEADVQRILDSSTGTFRDDFQKRSQPFIDVVQKAQSKSEGSITEAGIESEDADQALVLVAVTVNTSIAGAAAQGPRAWRMRISVHKDGDGAKVSNVEFVP